MKVLITGANGMVARAAIKHCQTIGDDVIELTRHELDISDRDAVFEAMVTYLPDAVLNCAAFTDVDGAETNPDGARAANSVGVRNLAEGCKDQRAKLISISTDYVFDGQNRGFYTELDAPNPRGVYATTKYEGEIEAAKANPDSVIVRSGWIYGRGGTNFLSVMHTLLRDGKRIKAIRDSYGTPTYANDLAKRLREFAGMEEIRGTFHVTNSGEGTSYLGFAEKVCEIGGFDKSLLEEVSNDDLKRPAPRPVSSKLGTAFSSLPPLRDWESALREFLSDK